jgi:hypothetical protein
MIVLTLPASASRCHTSRGTSTGGGSGTGQRTWITIRAAGQRRSSRSHCRDRLQRHLPQILIGVVGGTLAQQRQGAGIVGPTGRNRPHHRLTSGPVAVGGVTAKGVEVTAREGAAEFVKSN